MKNYIFVTVHKSTHSPQVSLARCVADTLSKLLNPRLSLLYIALDNYMSQCKLLSRLPDCVSESGIVFSTFSYFLNKNFTVALVKPCDIKHFR